MLNTKISKKTALVTGASGGIGSEIANKLSQAGYRVILQGRNSEKLKNVQQKIANETLIITGDLTNEIDREIILNEAFRLDRIDLLVNCAGISHFGAFMQTTPETITELLTLNTLAPMLFVQHFIARIKQISPHSHHTIINVGSTFGAIGYPGFTSYCASKFALKGFTEALARELSDSKIRIAYFAPRATKTDINSSIVDDLNDSLGNSVDDPKFVAEEFMVLLNSKKSRKSVGWPEKLFARINGLIPELVDRSIAAQLVKIKAYFPHNRGV